MASPPQERLRNEDTEQISDTSVHRKLSEHAADRVVPILLVLAEHEIMRRVALDRPQTVVGRDSVCDIRLPDNKASRRHARIEAYPSPRVGEPPLVRLVDLESMNGSFVNGLRTKETFLHDGDKILIGKTLLAFFMRDEGVLRAEDRLLELATVDRLSGLSNRAIFDAVVQREFDRAHRGDEPAALALIDADRFKVVNDTYGHPAGDRVIAEIGAVARSLLGEGELAARYGGEEFAIIVRRPIDEALRAIETLRSRVASRAFAWEKGEFRVTLSAGVAAWREDLDDYAAWIRDADQALYRAKAAGRDRIATA